MTARSPLALPIPPLSEPPDWARLPIHECGEPLVPLPAVSDDGRVSVWPKYAREGVPHAPETVAVRQGVRDRLLRAAAALPPGVGLVVFDGFRPLAVQAWLYDTFTAHIRAARPDLTGQALRDAVGQFVASPSADPACPPPHRTGGAVDVFLRDAATGEPLAMGTAPDEAAPASATRWFEEHPEEPFTTRRRLLFHAMTGAGFTNYRGEWWHYDRGNQRWANCAGADHAVYGMAEG